MENKQSLIDPNYKKILLSVLGNNLNQLQELEGLDDSTNSKDKNKARKKLEQIYQNIRFKIQSGQMLTPAEIFTLGTAVNLTLMNLRTRRDYLEKTVSNFENIIVPNFTELLKHKEDPDSVVSKFYETFSEDFEEQVK